MRKLNVTLTDEQYQWTKQWGRLWVRDVIQSLMDSGYDGDIPVVTRKKRWWQRG